MFGHNFVSIGLKSIEQAARWSGVMLPFKYVLSVKLPFPIN